LADGGRPQMLSGNHQLVSGELILLVASPQVVCVLACRHPRAVAIPHQEVEGLERPLWARKRRQERRTSWTHPSAAPNSNLPGRKTEERPAWRSAPPLAQRCYITDQI